VTIGIILLLVCLGSLLIVWVGLNGVELGGALATGLICVLIGALAMIERPSETMAYFWLSLGFIIAGVVISVIAVRKQRALKNLSAAVCVAIAVITGFYAIQYLTG
jgi:uncharacterized membrane protein